MVCLITVLIIFLIYSTLLIWSKYQDRKDVSRGEIVILHDNYPGEDEVYLVTVYTGHSADAGTTANVCLQLHGNISSSRVHWLYNSNCDVLQRFNDDWFIIFTPKSLGEIESIHIWHDNYGKSPSWYCKRIEVTVVRKKKKWNFNVERWFTILNSIENIEHFIIKGTTNDWQTKAIDDVELTIREEYLWASVFIRHPRSLITRCQKLSRIICLLFSSMVISLLFYDLVDDDEEHFLKFEITLTQIYISIQSSLIHLLMTFTTTYCFNKGSRIEKYVTVQEVKMDFKIKKPWWRKLLTKIVPKKVIYLPAQMKEKSNQNTGINYWFLAGWTLCLLIYGLSTVLIITFGLKLGQVKSLHWLMALLITVLQNALISEPLQIIICSFIIFKLNQGQQHTLLSNYTINLDNFRKNTKNRLQNIRFIQSIRERRKRYVYSPMTRKSAQILQAKYKDKLRQASFQENVTTCLLLISISLFCISALYSFRNPKHIVHANNINKLFLKSILQTNMMNLEMMKTFLTGSFLNPFHIREYYNGIPIVNKSISYLSENNERGWCSFYNSKLVNGGIRIKQNRITEKNLRWETDTGSYEEGWIKITDIEKATAWIYRSVPVIKYFGLWFPDTKNSGFILDLTGQLSEYKQKINTHLENGWLDNRTRSLVIEFHTYTPGIDCITVFKIKFQTLSGLLYTIHSEVWTVPSSSAIVTWNTYVFTLVFMFAYAFMAVRLMVSLKHMVSAMYDHGGGAYRLLCAAYECVVLAVVMCAMFAVTGRWKLMELAHERYASARETAVVSSMTYMCQAHEHVAALASVTVAMGLFRTFQLVLYERRVSHVARALSASVRPAAAVVAYGLIVTYGAWSGVAGGGNGGSSGFFNAFVLSRAGGRGRDGASRPPPMATAVSAIAFLLLNATVVSIITKRYVLSKLYCARQ
ncbi:LOW QUALITY PROTEIN: polycystic kidney disease and receptor for egg jelly-related protein [Melanaphis sacchari]|uniref:LOW QUALITY PROTEIN: polycystic kidney disease and receptor for egg jelly-related protein n=1 Tax=Melanaphis sacchari TaxID=742174 RepID=UPI000DC1345F|nr:LOW QUALITY PROTEIN: polycystic kidney disease and receptor for egg jelly-related protein [Melanaphis sacchari]